MKHHVIYVPGLGDHKTYAQGVALNLWKLFGLSPTYLALGWEVQEGLDKKLQRLDALVKKLSDDGSKVSLVGVSAGASAVINYYQENHEIHKVVLVCGKVNNPDNVHPMRYKINPDFKTSMQRTKASLAAIQRKGLAKNILSVYSPHDSTVRPEDSYIEGAFRKKIWAWSHASVIANMLLFHGHTVAKFIKT